MPISTGVKRYAPVKLAYKYIEPGALSDGRIPVIFMHAVSCVKETWLDLPEIIAGCTKRKTYVLDARNHGDSERSDVWNYDANVDDLLHFMDSHDISRAILVGFAMGAITAYFTALREPDRVEKIFAVDMSVKSSTVKLVRSYLAAFGDAVNNMDPSFNELEAKKFIMKYLFQNLPYEIKYLGRQKYAEQIFHIIKTPDGRFASKNCFEKMVASLEKEEYLHGDFEGQYDGPVWLVYGKLSHTDAGLHESLMKVHFPNTKMVGIDNATTTIQRDCPKEFRNALLQFLREGQEGNESSDVGDEIGKDDYVDLSYQDERPHNVYLDQPHYDDKQYNDYVWS